MQERQRRQGGVELTLLWVEAEEGMMTFFRRPQLTVALPLHYAERSSAPCNVAHCVGHTLNLGGVGRMAAEHRAL